MKKRKVPGLLMIIAALICLCLAVFLAYQSFQFQKSNSTTFGTVVDIETRRSDPTSGSRSQIVSEVPQVKYSVKEVTYYTEPKWLLGISFEKGDSVLVFYNSTTPSEAKVETFGEFFGFPSIFVIASFFLFLAGKSIILEKKTARPVPRWNNEK